MRQRLGIAAALLRSPRLMLLDEPTSGLDPAGARDVRALVAELAAVGVAVLLSSHLIGEVAEISDSFTVLRRGSVAWSGTAAELRAQAPTATYAMRTSDDQLALQIAQRHPGIAVVTSSDGALGSPPGTSRSTPTWSSSDVRASRSVSCSRSSRGWRRCTSR